MKEHQSNKNISNVSQNISPSAPHAYAGRTNIRDKKYQPQFDVAQQSNKQDVALFPSQTASAAPLRTKL